MFSGKLLQAFANHIIDCRHRLLRGVRFVHFRHMHKQRPVLVHIERFHIYVAAKVAATEASIYIPLLKRSQ